MPRRRHRRICRHFEWGESDRPHVTRVTISGSRGLYGNPGISVAGVSRLGCKKKARCAVDKKGKKYKCRINKLKLGEVDVQ